MPEPIVTPEPQFCDANGAPFAGGTITTYIPGTDTLANTWSDLGGTALNTNPIVLDAAGRCLIYGSGEYRLVLKDASGNLIWDQISTSFISDAMKSVVQADSISAALDLMGVTTAIQTETDRAMAAEGAIITNSGTISSDVSALAAQLATQLGGGVVQGGLSTTNSYGFGTANFARAYSADPVVICTPYYGSAISVSMVASSSTTNFNAWASDATGTGVGIGFMWIAFGPM